jgi:hypothetical protein
MLRMLTRNAHLHSCILCFGNLAPSCAQDLLREELAELLSLSGSSFKVELVMRLLGLPHVRDTMIGSAMVRMLTAEVF